LWVISQRNLETKDSNLKLIMSGGAGHIMDMNNRMRQNRSMKSSNKQKFKSNNRDLDFKKGNSKKLEFKKVSDKELERIKFKIRQKAKAERKREKIIFISIILIISIVIYIIAF
jgi:hypothetical protein